MRRLTPLAGLILIAAAVSGCSLLGINTDRQTLPAMSSTSSAQSPLGQTSVTPTPVTKPAGLVLTGKGLGTLAFGSAAAPAEASLRGMLGAPSSVDENAGCALSPVWTRTLSWQNFRVIFEGTVATKTTMLTLRAWELRSPFNKPEMLTLAAPLTTTMTLAQLESNFPNLTQSTLGGDDTIADTGAGIFYYYPGGAQAAGVIAGGAMMTCE